jgi:hypothetical protein
VTTEIVTTDGAADAAADVVKLEVAIDSR